MVNTKNIFFSLFSSEDLTTDIEKSLWIN
jgi:hypothetical protein